MAQLQPYSAGFLALLLFVLGPIYLFEVVTFYHPTSRPATWISNYRRCVFSIPLVASLAVFGLLLQGVVRAGHDIITHDDAIEPINADIAGDGIRYSIMIIVFTLPISLIIGFFHSTKTGSKELGITLLVFLVCLSVNLLISLRRQSLTLPEQLVACMQIDAVGAAVFMAFSEKETLSSRWFVTLSSFFQFLALSIVGFAVLKLTNEPSSITGQCHFHVFWGGDFEFSSQNLVPQSFWFYFAFRILTTTHNAWLALSRTMLLNAAEHPDLPKTGRDLSEDESTSSAISFGLPLTSLRLRGRQRTSLLEGGGLSESNMPNQRNKTAEPIDGEALRRKNQNTSLQVAYGLLPSTLFTKWIELLVFSVLPLCSVEILLRQCGGSASVVEWGQLQAIIAATGGMLHLIYVLSFNFQGFPLPIRGPRDVVSWSDWMRVRVGFLYQADELRRSPWDLEMRTWRKSLVSSKWVLRLEKPQSEIDLIRTRWERALANCSEKDALDAICDASIIGGEPPVRSGDLVMVARWGSVTMAKLLATYQDLFQVLQPELCEAIREAVQSKRFELVKFLLESRDLDPEVKAEADDALMGVIGACDKTTVQPLLQHRDLFPYWKTRINRALAIVQDTNPQVLPLLFSLGAELGLPESVLKDKKTVSIQAASKKYCDAEELWALLESFRDDLAIAALGNAIKSLSTALAASFAHGRKSLYIVQETWVVSLLVAVRKHDVGMALYFLETTAEFQINDALWQQIFYEARRGGMYDVWRSLLDQTKSSQFDRIWRDVFATILEVGDWTVLTELVSFAPRNLPLNDEAWSISFLRAIGEFDKRELQELLQAEGAVEKGTPNQVWSKHAFLWAMRKFYQPLTRRLIEHDAINSSNVNAVDDNGRTALDMAMERRDEDTIRSLLRAGAKKRNAKTCRPFHSKELPGGHGVWV